MLRLNLLEYGLFEKGGGISFNCHHILSRVLLLMYPTAFWRAPGILCHITSTYASREDAATCQKLEVHVSAECYAECTSEMARSGSGHCILPRVCRYFWGITVAICPMEWIFWMQIVMCCHPPGGCWLSNTTKGWVSWKKWWLKVVDMLTCSNFLETS